MWILFLKIMQIGQLSKKTGLSRDTIRFYEKKGLIPTALKQNEFNSYKNYSHETLEKLLIIKKMKGFGFTLNEISDFLGLMEFNTASCENVSQKMLEKVRLIDKKMKELNEMKSLIIGSLDSCAPEESKSTSCPLVSVNF
ncbi:MerR family transcriptional regulator [Muricauda sp. TY007]|nr:MerR family transcriptional regulator [Muricauda sp. TY007]|tara:strand:+ start:5060 stop:5479 length:420 start_codon:yes stop_codon:yes gene_type:complete